MYNGDVIVAVKIINFKKSYIEIITIIIIVLGYLRIFVWYIEY